MHGHSWHFQIPNSIVCLDKKYREEIQTRSEMQSVTPMTALISPHPIIIICYHRQRPPAIIVLANIV